MSNRRKVESTKLPANGMVAAALKLQGADRRTKRANRRRVPVIAVLEAIHEAQAIAMHSHGTVQAEEA